MNYLLIKEGDEDFFIPQLQMYLLIMFTVVIFHIKDTELILNIMTTFSIKTYGVPLYIQPILALLFSIMLSFFWLYYKSERKKSLFDFSKELFLVILLPLIYLMVLG